MLYRTFFGKALSNGDLHLTPCQEDVMTLSGTVINIDLATGISANVSLNFRLLPVGTGVYLVVRVIIQTQFYP